MIRLFLSIRCTDRHVECTALIQLVHQCRTGAEIQIGISEDTFGCGVYKYGSINGIAHLHCRCFFNFEHGVNSVRSLLGHEHLAAYILLLCRGCRIVHRVGNSFQLPFGNACGNDQLQLTGIVSAPCSQVTLQDAHRYPGPCCAGRQSEVIRLFLSIRCTDRHVECTALIQLVHQCRTGAEIQIGISEDTFGCGVYKYGSINGIAHLHCRCFFNFEHGVNSVRSLLGHEHLAAYILLLCRGCRIAHRLGNGFFLCLLCRSRFGRLSRLCRRLLFFIFLSGGCRCFFRSLGRLFRRILLPFRSGSSRCFRRFFCRFWIYLNLTRIFLSRIAGFHGQNRHCIPCQQTNRQQQHNDSFH